MNLAMVIQILNGLKGAGFHRLCSEAAFYYVEILFQGCPSSVVSLPPAEMPCSSISTLICSGCRKSLKNKVFFSFISAIAPYFFG